MKPHSSDTLDHEKLSVYQASIALIVWSENVLRTIPAKHAVKDQMERASTSIALNIAEGNGRFTPRDRCRFFDNARGSALECAAALDIMAAKSLITASDASEGKRQIIPIISMLVGLIRNNSSDRVYEDRGEYLAHTARD